MPNDPGPSSWLEDQYQRFIKGIDQVGNPNAARLVRSQAKVRVDPGKNPEISLPAWNDIVRTGPRVPVTDEDWNIQRHFEQAKLHSPLAPDVQDEIGRRRESARRMRNSAIPEYQQGVTTLVTVVDNVQDAALTASVATRVAIPALGRFGPYLAPATLALGQIASLLNYLNVGLFHFGALYALACQGPKAAVAQYSVKNLAAGLFGTVHAILPRTRGIPAPRPGQWQKGRMAAMMAGTPAGRALTNSRGSRWGLARVTFGEGLQAAQVAADVTGYGLSLGAVMGFIGETAYGAERALRGEPVRVRSPKVNHVFAALIHERVKQLGAGALWHREQCARALAAAPFVLRDPDTFGDELYGLTWLTVYVAVEPLMWDTQGIPWRDAVIDALPARWTPWDVRDRVSRGILEEQGADLEQPGRWPIPGAPYELEAQQLTDDIAHEVSRQLTRWLDAAPLDPWRRFVAEMSMRVCERLWWWLEGYEWFPRWQLTPTAAVWESLWQADRWPIVSDPPERIAAAWAASEQLVKDTGRKYLDVEQLDQVWAEHGSPLLRILPDAASVPPEHLAPYDPETGQPGDAAYGPDVTTARERLTQEHAERDRPAAP